VSFILDALKKSEQERIRQQAPTTLELPRGTRRRVVPIWMIGVVLLLLLNCVLLFMLWLRREPAPAPATQVPVAVPAEPVGTPAVHPAQTAQTIRSLEEEASVYTPPVEDQESTYQSAPAAELTTTTPPPVGDTPLVRAVPTTPQSSESVSSVAAPATPRRGVISGMPTLESLGGHAALNLPDLRMDLHVYSRNAKDRFVFINGKRYHEGDTTAEGAMIESITDEGAVLTAHGQRFLLPR
jgi:general secretion pathway protein B